MHDQSRAWPAPQAQPAIASFAPPQRRVGPLLAWLGCLSAALALLLWLGDGRLAAPDLTEPSSWAAWAAQRQTAEVAVAALRVIALGLSWYLVGVTTVSVLAHALRAARLIRLADALSVGPVRVVVQQALGVGLAAGVLATAVPGGGGAAVAAQAPDEPATTVTATVVTSDAEGAVSPPGATLVATAVRGSTAGATEQLVPIPAPGAVASQAPRPAPELDPPDAPSAAPVAPPAPVAPAASTAPPAPAAPGEDVVAGERTVRVASGDHLWGLAEADLTAQLGVAPSEAQVAHHWERLIEHNRDRLVVPSNPDLLHPGQVLVLPDVEVAP